jgi:hypothetical protein
LKCESQAYICVVDKAEVAGFGSLTIKNSLWQEGGIGHVDELIVSLPVLFGFTNLGIRFFEREPQQQPKYRGFQSSFSHRCGDQYCDFTCGLRAGAEDRRI